MTSAPKKPRYDLAAAKRVEPQIGNACARRACAFLGTEDAARARKHIKKLFRRLTASDFAYVETMPQRSGRPRYGDVYGLEDEYGVWFLKLELDGGVTTVILSCHEAERSLTLVDGRTLRKSS